MRAAKPDMIRTSLAVTSPHLASVDAAKLLIFFGLARQLQVASWA
jgi:hypothetical protein